MFFQEGENCWQTAKTARAAFLVDGEAYFNAFADACEAAQKTIYILGWDVDSRIRLRRGEAGSDEDFGSFIDRLAEDNPDLEVFILEWDFAMLYSLERETWPLLSLGWKTHERVHFALDDEHPVGASHHQKVVVIDDRIAFVGGFDLASCRWDTREHEPDNPARVDNDEPYGPFHDIQMLVDGEAAARLGELARFRWERATGDRLPAPQEVEDDPWPEQLDAALENASVALLRTMPEHDGEDEIREVERFYLDAIDAAERWIYIENQYLTSHRIGQALADSLGKDDGPEVLLVLPRRCSGWLEQETMGALRQRLVRKLRAADQHDRLKICYPDRRDFDQQVINVHSKVMIVDDRLLTIGSANLSNRSMGFDSECNLALAVDEDDDLARAVAVFRSQLLAEHLGASAEEIAADLEADGSLLGVVQKFNDGERYLADLALEDEEELVNSLSADRVVDPERPANVDRLLDQLGLGEKQRDQESAIRGKALRFGLVILAAAILAILWRWSPLSEWLNLDTLLAAADYVRASPLTVPIVLAIYLVGSCIMFPITLMILATALTFGPIQGFLLALGGSLLGGLASYLLGRWLGRDAVRRLAGDKVNRLSRKLARRGWLAIAVLRVVPVAPYTIVNLVAGATHISTRSFLVGTAVGMGPGILAIMIFEGGLERAVRDPGWGTAGLAILALVAGGLILFYGRRWLTRQSEEN